MSCGVIPEMLVAPAPKILGVAAHYFLGRKIDAAIQRFENVAMIWENQQSFG